MTFGSPDADPSYATTDLGSLSVTRLVKSLHVDGLGVGWGPSRFVPDPTGLPPDRRFRALYAASTLDTAFAEAILRDRAAARTATFLLDLDELAAWDVVSIHIDRLRVVDLTGPRMLAARVPTDAVRAQDQASGQALGLALHHHRSAPDGVLYPSRLTGEANIVVFDRAIGAGLRQTDRLPLLEVTDFARILDLFEIRIA